MIEMSSGIGATAMGIGVSHGTGGGEGVAGGCRLRAQSQGQASGSSANPQQSSQQQQQQQQQPPSSQQPQQQQQRQPSGIMGRSKKDNCCLCWCCCCSCSNKCLAAVRGNTAGAGGTGEQTKKKSNVVEHEDDVDELCDTGYGLDGLDSLDGLDGNAECSLEEIRSWASSFDKLMRHPIGRKFFREFLLSEYSEENIAFWLACEQLKRESNSENIEENARYIYDRYISTVSEREVSLDSQVREIVNRNMVQPTPHTFDEAQLQIYTLMHRDSYPRFVNSEIYRRLERLGCGTTGSSNQEHATAKSKGKKGTT